MRAGERRRGQPNVSAATPTHDVATVSDGGATATAPARPATTTSDDRSGVAPPTARSVRLARLGLWVTIPLACAIWVGVPSTWYS